MNYLITGSSGFIGSRLAWDLLEAGHTVVGIDNHNDYYDPALKQARLEKNQSYSNFSHYQIPIENETEVAEVFQRHEPEMVINLAAQAGVRYSLENPLAYARANQLGFAVILEQCRHFKVQHLVFASSSSVYGGNTKQPFSEQDPVDHPVSLYAATKKSNELMAHTYSHLYGLPATGLRFFTVYGPWDRPDMALQKFTRKILNNEPIQLFNYGNHRRDFTYIDDIVNGVLAVLPKVPEPDPGWNSDQPDPATSNAPWRILNIGSNRPQALKTYVSLLEDALGKKAQIELLPLQPGDVPDTYADITRLTQLTGFKPQMNLQAGVKRFAEWYLDFYKP